MDAVLLVKLGAIVILLVLGSRIPGFWTRRLFVSPPRTQKPDPDEPSNWREIFSMLCATLVALLLVIPILRHAPAFGLEPTTDVPHLLQRLKGGSAIVADKERHAAVPLRWARGYTIESVSRSALADARSYVRGQPTRHPDLAIPGWTPVEPVSGSREEEWIGENRKWIGPRTPG